MQGIPAFYHQKSKGENTPKHLLAEKRGEPTKYNLMREALDAALKVSVDGNDLSALREWIEENRQRYAYDLGYQR